MNPRDMLIGALLRVPAQAIHRRLIDDLNAAGFEELSLPHMAVLQFPGPDGVRPGTLATRAGMSKQAMNQLLRSLETGDYLVRSDAPDEGRARVVRLTSAVARRRRRLWKSSARLNASGPRSSAPHVSPSSRICWCRCGEKPPLVAAPAAEGAEAEEGALK
jgi:DNA-binding MarR family transcriptional regulator